MVQRRILLAVVAAAALVGGCGSSSTDDTAATDGTIGGAQAATVTDPSARVGSIGDAVEVAVGALEGADAAACELDHRTLADASELYLVLNGSLPANLDALVEAQLVTEPSALFEITADGAIVPAPGSPCV